MNPMKTLKGWPAMELFHIPWLSQLIFPDFSRLFFTIFLAKSWHKNSFAALHWNLQVSIKMSCLFPVLLNSPIFPGFPDCQIGWPPCLNKFDLNNIYNIWINIILKHTYTHILLIMQCCTNHEFMQRINNCIFLYQCFNTKKIILKT